MRKRPLRRILLSVVGTVSTVVLMLALKPHTSPEDHTAAAPALSASAEPSPDRSSSRPPSPRASASASPSRKPTDPAAPAPSRSATTDEPAADKPATEQPTAPQTRTVTGSAVSTKYGTVQVRITLSGDRITASAAVRCPSSTPRSEDICAEAVPTLNAAAVTAQSADIATVSGATYTSEGYRGSLQSALDRA